MRIGLLMLVLLVLPSGVQAQGTCSTGSAQVDLDVADVRARLYTIGNLFWRGAGAMYEVPRGSDTHAVFSAGLWVGGEVAGTLRFAGSTYSPWEFWPGPLDAQARTTQSRCAGFDRLWSVLRSDVLAYGATGTATPDLASWPVAQGAPFYVDANANGRRDADEPRLALAASDPGYSIELGQGRQINLAAGERPDLVGDQGVWWVMNDAGNVHGWGGTPPLGIEVRVLAYAFDEADPAVRQSTFYQYTITNRGTSAIQNLRAGFYADIDVGDYQDDYIASDAARGMVVGYNGREVDDPAQGGYGAGPPAIGIDLLSGAAGTYNFRLTSSLPFPNPEPTRAEGAWRQLQSLHRDGLPVTRGGDGYNPGQTDGVTTWHYDGDPVTHAFWTEERTLPSGGPSRPDDRLAVISAPAETLAPGASRQVDVAILFAWRGPSEQRSRLESVVRLRDLSDAVQAAYDAGGTPAIRSASVSYTPPPPALPVAALIAPAGEVDFNATRPESVTFVWSAVPGATRYRLDLSGSPAFEPGFATLTRYTAEPSATLRAAILPSHPGEWTYWRVSPESWGGVPPPGEVRRFAYTVLTPRFTNFQTLANAAGVLDPPDSAAIPSFPGVTALPSLTRQQVNRTRWLIFTAGDVTTYGQFVARTTRDGANWPRIAPFDFEIRFAGTSLGKVNGFFGQTGPDMTVPFEIWNIGAGTPDDPSDDYRMIPVIRDADGSGTFNLSTLDSPVNTGNNDPYTDEVYFYDPVDRMPGQAGYQAFFAGGAGDVAQIGEEGLARIVFVGLNLGASPPYSAPAAGGGGPVSGPEPGTVFRISTDLRGGVVSGEPDAPESAPRETALGVYPNPVRTSATVPFTLGAPADVRLVLVDVLGREVAVLATGPHARGEHRATLGAARLAPGVYVLVLETAGARTTRRITVVR